MLYTSLLKCICIIFTNQNTHNIFYYKTLGNVIFEICNLKVTPVFATSMKHQRRTLENRMNSYIVTMTNKASDLDSTGIPSSSSTRGSGCRRGPCQGFSPSSTEALGFASHRGEQSPAAISMTATDQYWAVCVSTMFSCSERPYLLSKTCTWGQDPT